MANQTGRIHIQRPVYFDLHSNNLNGELPTEIGNLTAMVLLDLSGNNLKGTIPTEVGKLTALQVLALSSNKLGGAIPKELGLLTDLEVLFLGYNQLSGSIPASLGNLNKVWYLTLYYNQLTGNIPPELGNMSALWHLQVMGNQLTGAIPPELGKLKNLRSLALFGNQLSGPIPDTLGDYPELLEYLLNGNQLSGPIPEIVGKLPKLRHLHLNGNHLSGPIPPILGNLTEVIDFQLEGNQLSGTIPTSLGNLHNVLTFQLHDNQLSGVIPSTLVSLTAVYTGSLTLSENALTAHDPALLSFLAARSSGWENWQTVPPTDVKPDAGLGGGVLGGVTWAPILYTSNGGYYEVFVSEDGVNFKKNNATTDKTSHSATVPLPVAGTTYTFRVRSFTPKHGTQQNDIYSDYSPVTAMRIPQVGKAAITIVLHGPAGDTSNVLFSSPTLGSFYLDDGGRDDGDAYLNIRSFDVSAGKFQMTERLSRRTNYLWALGAIECGPGKQAAVDVTTRQANITVAAGESVTCTYINANEGNLGGEGDYEVFLPLLVR